MVQRVGTEERNRKIAISWFKAASAQKPPLQLGSEQHSIIAAQWKPLRISSLELYRF